MILPLLSEIGKGGLFLINFKEGENMTIPKDKLLHFVAGLICATFVYLITLNLTLAIGASVILGAGKEVYDSRGHGTVEVLDAVATALGGVVGAVLMRVVILCQ